MKYRSGTSTFPTSTRRPTSIDGAGRSGEHLRRLPQRPGHPHLPREAVAGSAGQDADPCGAADRISDLEDGVGELVLGPVAAIADHQVHAVARAAFAWTAASPYFLVMLTFQSTPCRWNTPLSTLRTGSSLPEPG